MICAALLSKLLSDDISARVATRTPEEKNKSSEELHCLIAAQGDVLP